MQDRRQAISNTDLMQELELGSAEASSKADKKATPSIPGLDFDVKIIPPIRYNFLAKSQAYLSVIPQQHKRQIFSLTLRIVNAACVFLPL